jgi:hypothetical protein
MKISEMDEWLGGIPRDAWLEISVQESDWSSFSVQAGALADLAMRRVERISVDETALANSDGGKYLRFEFEGPKTLTINDEATMGAGLPDWAEIEIRNASTGLLQIVVNSSDVFVYPPGGGTLFIPEGGSAVLKRIDVDEYDLIGVTVPEVT